MGENPVSRVGRWLRRQVERWLDRYYGGPEPPLLIAHEVALFAREHPAATVEQWMRFATSLGRSQYRLGYLQGLEWQQRDQNQLPPVPTASPQRTAWVPPGAVTDAELAMVVPRDPESFVESIPDPKAQAQVLDMIGRLGGGFRVMIKPP